MQKNKNNSLLKELKKKLFRMSNAIYVSVFAMLLIIVLSFVGFKNLTKPKDLQDYLKSAGYKKDKWDCYTNEVKNSIPEIEKVQFCYNECKYFSTQGPDSIVINFNTNEAIFKTEPSVSYTFKLDEFEKGTCDLLYDDRGLEKGTDEYDAFCKYAKNRAKVRVETYEGIIQNYTIKCNPIIKVS